MPEKITCEECEKEISDREVVFCELCMDQGQAVWLKLLSELLDALGIKPGHHIGEDVERAKEIVLGWSQLSARDAVHLAVMERHGITQILSFDLGFDQFPGISRIQS